MKTGQVGILNVGTGDTKLSFDPANAAERIRAARIVTDMIRRGYVLLVEIERAGMKAFQRVERFDEDKCEYIIADFDPLVAQHADHEEADGEEKTNEAGTFEEKSPKPKCKKPAKRALKAEESRAVAIPRRAGG